VSAEVPALALYFAGLYQQRLGLSGIELSPEALAQLLSHTWPGNIRELENVIHHALLVCKGGYIRPGDLRLTSLPARGAPSDVASPLEPGESIAAELRRLFESDAPNLYDAIERIVFRTAYEFSERNQLQTARLLGISRNIVRARLIEFGEITNSVRPPPLKDASVVQQTPAVSGPSQPSRPIRIGYQRFGLLPLVKAQGGLDAVLGVRGYRVEWLEYPGGIQIVEAFQSAQLALASVGEGPPVFAHAASVPLVYLAAESPAPEDEALIVPESSTIRTVRDLAGGRVALNRGANVHYLLIRALEEAGLAYDSVEVVYLTPAEARVAFERGEVDAWAIWSPLLGELVRSGTVRVLRDASGLADNAVLYVANPTFAATEPAVIELFFSQLVGVAASVAPHRVPRRVDEALLAGQQAVADAFHRHRLISNEVRMTDARWVKPRPPAHLLELVNGVAHREGWALEPQL